MDERRHFVVRFRSVHYVYLRCTMGPRGGPLLWGRFEALLARFTVSVAAHAIGKAVVSLDTYVDDPLLKGIGPPEFRAKRMALTLFPWLTLGLSLSFEMSTFGNRATLTSAHFTIRTSEPAVVVTIIPGTTLEKYIESVIYVDTLHLAAACLPVRCAQRSTEWFHLECRFHGWNGSTKLCDTTVACV